MFTLVIGGSASGKSEYAERHVLSLEGEHPRIYLATMEPFGEEAQARIRRHQAVRRGRGFGTVEQYRDLEAAPVPEGANVLLEDLGNLLANEMFSSGDSPVPAQGGSPVPAQESCHVPAQGDSPVPARGCEAADRVLRGILRLQSRCAHLTVVTNEVFTGGMAYAGETLVYLRALARLNRELASRADRVVEVACGIPVSLKAGRQTLYAAGKPWAACGTPCNIEIMGDRDKQSGRGKGKPRTACGTPCNIEINGEKQRGRGTGEAEEACGIPSVIDIEGGKQSVRRIGKPRAQGKRETGMIFVTGPLFAGKQDYIMGLLGWEEEDFARHAVRDVQELAAQAAMDLQKELDAQAAMDLREELPAKAQAETGKTGGSFAAKSLAATQTGPAPAGSGSHELRARLRDLADALARKQVVIATEVGGGVVPADPVERRAREAAGRLACLLAARADTVIRVTCGLPQLLKGDAGTSLL